MKDETLKEKSKWGGARDGAGRPKGGMNESTKLKLEAERELKQRIIDQSQRLLDKQLSLADGCQYLMVIHTEYDDKGKPHKSKPEVVTDEKTIREYLNGNYDSEKDDYYFITTERPDTRVLDSLLDRAFGKAQQSTDVTSKGEQVSAGIFIDSELL